MSRPAGPRETAASPSRESSPAGEIADRLLGLAPEPQEERTEDEAQNRCGHEEEAQKHRIPEQRMHVARDRRLDQGERAREQPKRHLAERREAHGPVGDRARAVDDEADEGGGKEDQAEGTGEKAEHRDLGEAGPDLAESARAAQAGAMSCRVPGPSAQRPSACTRPARPLHDRLTAGSRIDAASAGPRAGATGEFARASDPISGRGGRAVEGARLERVYTGNRIEGSNPSPSATLASSTFHD